MSDPKQKSPKKMSTTQIQGGMAEEPEGDPEDEEFVDEVEEPDCEDGADNRGTKGGTVGRTITLQMLLESNILQPGEANMSIEYLGQRFIGDLLHDGKIKSLETDIIFASPSAWASHCKRIINPDKKSGCGWASVKYLGQKLDVFKNKYFKLKALEQEGKDHESAAEEEDLEVKQTLSDAPRIPVKHGQLGNRNNLHDVNTLVECVPFSSVGKIQPFLVSMSTNAALVLDFHCHLTTSEVVGYLAGHWDVNAHNLAITAALPCRSRLNDRELGPLVEEDIMRNIESRRLTLVGWYHSHPTAPPLPTLKDIDAQLDYEIRMKGNSDASYIPCVGLICSPYHQESMSLESALSCFWVVPPPESKPLEYGKPMTMTYSVIQDQFLSQDALNEMKKCAEFYRGDQDFVRFSEKYKDNITYLEKLKASVSGKFPREQNDGLIWSCLSDVIAGGAASTSTSLPPPITVPSPAPTAASPASSVSVPTSLSHTQPPPFSLASADLASALLASAKFQPPPGLLSSLPAPRLPPPPPLSSTSTS